MDVFFKDWLKSWTGNTPEKLINFYTDDVFYLDPHLKEGVKGKEEFFQYLKKLLSKNPRWTWQLVEFSGAANKFYVKWACDIPMGQDIFKTKGLDIVELRNDKIMRNEVYFDTFEFKNLLAR